MSFNDRDPSSHRPPLYSKKSSSSTTSKSSQSAASYISYPVSHVVSGLYRRLTEAVEDPSAPKSTTTTSGGSRHATTFPTSASAMNSSTSSFHTPIRTGSPFQPPPLTPLTLSSSEDSSDSSTSPPLLTRALAEEIRLLVPPRLQLVDTWRLAYSLERDGSSLATLYEKCDEYSHRSQRAGYVLVVRDSSSTADGGGGGGGGSGGPLFGAYLTDAPHPAPHYYGTGECFLWRASVLSSTPLMMQATAGHSTNGNGGGIADFLQDTNSQSHSQSQPHSEQPQQRAPLPSDDLLELAGLPLPPSANTENLRTRSTTLRSEKRAPRVQLEDEKGGIDLLEPPDGSTNGTSGGGMKPPSRSGASTPERIRFKAFPYSGENDYMIFCETGFLSVGAGDSHFGLWLDDSFEKGVTNHCPTFGNEILSDQGSKFDVLGVEMWYIGS
ncbi:oxidation resistance protein 1 [Arachnomyces sp. PD_36]|nr:oxidation resistance protein 1 [Arachnomyces sp. PD_36]